MTPDITTAPHLLFCMVMIAYLIGSVPFGIVIAHLFGLGDLREIGSGNIGATNVLRTGNKMAAFLTLICDAGKGAAMVFLARFALGEDAAQIAGFAAFLGHIFPVWLKFEGGKGVATFLGTLLALSFPLGLAACLTWLVIAVLFRFSSLAALIAALTTPAWAWGLGTPSLILLCIVLAALVWLRHVPNIKRLLDGSETKIGSKG